MNYDELKIDKIKEYFLKYPEEFIELLKNQGELNDDEKFNEFDAIDLLEWASDEEPKELIKIVKNEQERKKQQHKCKKVIGCNVNYFLKHAEEIINEPDTYPFINPYWISGLYSENSKQNKQIKRFAIRWRKSHVNADMAFGGRGYYRWGGETESQSLYRIDHDYCEATGRWDLFIWEDIPKEELYDYLPNEEKI